MKIWDLLGYDFTTLISHGGMLDNKMSDLFHVMGY
jgi:hypothetical protein